MFVAICPKCSTKFEVADDKAGKRGRCSHCGHTFALVTPSENHLKSGSIEWTVESERRAAQRRSGQSTSATHRQPVPAGSNHASRKVVPRSTSGEKSFKELRRLAQDIEREYNNAWKMGGIGENRYVETDRTDEWFEMAIDFALGLTHDQRTMRRNNLAAATSSCDVIARKGVEKVLRNLVTEEVDYVADVLEQTYLLLKGMDHYSRSQSTNNYYWANPTPCHVPLFALLEVSPARAAAYLVQMKGDGLWKLEPLLQKHAPSIPEAQLRRICRWPDREDILETVRDIDTLEESVVKRGEHDFRAVKELAKDELQRRQQKARNKGWGVEPVLQLTKQVSDALEHLALNGGGRDKNAYQKCLETLAEREGGLGRVYVAASLSPDESLARFALQALPKMASGSDCKRAAKVFGSICLKRRTVENQTAEISQITLSNKELLAMWKALREQSKTQHDGESAPDERLSAIPSDQAWDACAILHLAKTLSDALLENGLLLLEDNDRDRGFLRYLEEVSNQENDRARVYVAATVSDDIELARLAGQRLSAMLKGSDRVKAAELLDWICRESQKTALSKKSLHRLAEVLRSHTAS